MTSFVDNINSWSKKNDGIKSLQCNFKTCHIDNGRLLKTLIPAMYALLLYFVTLIAGKRKVLRAIINYN
jgi:hypothetical protein